MCHLLHAREAYTPPWAPVLRTAGAPVSSSLASCCCCCCSRCASSEASLFAKYVSMASLKPAARKGMLVGRQVATEQAAPVPHLLHESLKLSLSPAPGFDPHGICSTVRARTEFTARNIMWKAWSISAHSLRRPPGRQQP